MNISNILIYWFLCLIYELQYKNKQILRGRRNFYWILLLTTYLPKMDFAGVNATCNDKDLSQAKYDLTTSTFIVNTFCQILKNSVDPLHHGMVSIQIMKVYIAKRAYSYVAPLQYSTYTELSPQMKQYVYKICVTKYFDYVTFQ